MKTILATTFAVAAAIVAANAQDLVAGFSFTGINVGSDALAVAADKSDLIPDASVGPSLGVFHFDGSFGSTDFFNSGGAGVAYTTAPGGLNANTDITTRPAVQDFVNNDDFLRLSSLTELPYDNFVVEINVGSLFEDWTVNYGAGVGNGDGFDLNWAYSIDGGSTFTNVAVDSVSSGDKAGTFSIAGSASSSLLLQGSFANFDSASFQVGGGEQAFFDNFAVYGTAVPEPSTYAAIAGALALAFVAYRRRR